MSQFLWLSSVSVFQQWADEQLPRLIKTCPLRIEIMLSRAPCLIGRKLTSAQQMSQGALDKKWTENIVTTEDTITRHLHDCFFFSRASLSFLVGDLLHLVYFHSVFSFVLSLHNISHSTHSALSSQSFRISRSSALECYSGNVWSRNCFFRLWNLFNHWRPVE